MEEINMERYFKTEGNLIYPDKQMLTWGPFYYHSIDLGMERMNQIIEDIVNWVNLKDPTLDIKPENFIKPKGGRMIVFKIKAWKNENTLEDCDAIITIEDIFFEDEE